MNWINAKDRLPESGQLCLIAIPRYNVFYIARFFAAGTLEDLPFFACLPNMGYVVDDVLDIYWIALKEISMPGLK